MPEFVDTSVLESERLRRWAVMFVAGFVVSTMLLLALEFSTPANVTGPYLSPPWTSVSGAAVVTVTVAGVYGVLVRATARFTDLPLAFAIAPAVSSVVWVLPSTYQHQAEVTSFLTAAWYGVVPWWILPFVFTFLYLMFLIPLSAGRLTLRFYGGESGA